MTPRKRVELTINLQKPDRVPIDIGGTASNFTNELFFKLKYAIRVPAEASDREWYMVYAPSPHTTHHTLS